MEVTLSGIVISLRLEHPEKARPPMEVTLSGIVIFFKLAQSQKAESPIICIPCGMSYSSIVNVHGYVINLLSGFEKSTLFIVAR